MIIVNSRFMTQPITGVQRFAIEICIRLKKHFKDEIQFVTPSNIINYKLAKELDAQIIGKKTGHLWEQIDLPKYLIKNNKPLLLNLCNTAPLFYKNKIITVHDVAFEVFPETYSKGFVFFYKFLIPRIMRNSLKVITVSEFSQKEIIKYYKLASDKIKVVHNAAGDEFKNMVDIDLEKENYFLAVSSLNSRKNLLFVMDAFNIFNASNPSFKLFIIGGIDTKSFSTLNLSEYKKNPNIDFKGRVSDSDLIKYYSNAKSFIYPSLYEGFGIPPLEAQKCGTPVILSKETCFPEIFKNSVLYCDIKDVNSLVEQMENVLNERTRNQIIRDGKKNGKKYNWESNSILFISVINKFYL
jgi:glycosyltransferase involved in cell wall biosynthesis